jgi:GNAT superfamily N-acetyltransferase
MDLKELGHASPHAAEAPVEIDASAMPMEVPRHYETRCGTVSLRRQETADAAFLFALFCAHAGRPLRQGGLPEAAIAPMMDFQYRASTAAHRTLFPNAAYGIIESAGAPIGRLIEQEEGDAVYFVDFALVPERQAHGLGTAFIEMVADEWATRGRDARVEVQMLNEPSLKLCRKLGFLQTAEKMGYIELRRPAHRR